MEYRNLGSTDLNLPVITFGAWAAGGWMWGGADRNEAIRAIHASYDLGVNAIDTAPIYGQGESESLVGEAIRGYSRDKIFILTKYGMRWDLKKGTFDFTSKTNNGKTIDIYKYAGKDSIRKECEDSLRRLRTDYIDLYQIHWPDKTTPIHESMEVVAQLIKEGKVRYAGVCNYSADQMKEAESVLPIASNQVPYNMIRRAIEEDVVPYCLQTKKGILAYSPLERGLLTGKLKPGHVFKEGDHRADVRFFSDENIKRTHQFLQRIKPIADERGVSLAQLVLRWTLAQPAITVALAGARNEQQAEENARAGDFKLSAEEIGAISKELEHLRVK